MRILTASLAVLLLVAICSLAEADHRVSRNAAISKTNEKEPTFCCFAYASHPMRRSIIRSAHRTSTTCPMEAVILVTRKGTQVCVDPKALWVQKYLEDLELLEY